MLRSSSATTEMHRPFVECTIQSCHMPSVSNVAPGVRGTLHPANANRVWTTAMRPISKINPRKWHSRCPYSPIALFRIPCVSIGRLTIPLNPHNVLPAAQKCHANVDGSVHFSNCLESTAVRRLIGKTKWSVNCFQYSECGRLTVRSQIIV